VRKQIQDPSIPLIYLITDRRLLTQAWNNPDLSDLIEFAKRAIEAGVDMVQIRERDLSARDVFFLAQILTKIAVDTSTKILVNDRADIAACTGAGVHLTTRSLTVDVARRVFGPQMLVGVSTHNLEEVEAAEKGGADFVVFGPIFETSSKAEYGPPVGIDELDKVTSSVTIPVLALGGIKRTNYLDVLEAGAAGIAGISMFTETNDLAELITDIKRRRTTKA
jgi:thiamine-phosphate pyrophosphorylase